MKPFTAIAAFVFALVTAVQLLRFALAWPVVINGFAVPLWASPIACLIAATLAVMLWLESRR